MKICKDGRIWGQNNRWAGNHLGNLTKRRIPKGGVKGNKNPMFGRRHSLEARIKWSKERRGERHWNWRGGLTGLNQKIRTRIESKLWRNAVLARDNWACRECGKQAGRLNAHHIKSFATYPELRFAIDNGKTMCFACHKATDNFCGRGEKRSD